jgi:hypothetical protein
MPVRLILLPLHLTLTLYVYRARMGRVILEIGGPNLRPEIAHAGSFSRSCRPFLRLFPFLAVMKLAAAKLPCTTEVVDRKSQARVGYDAVSLSSPLPRVVTLGEAQAMLAASTSPDTPSPSPPSA